MLPMPLPACMEAADAFLQSSGLQVQLLMSIRGLVSCCWWSKGLDEPRDMASWQHKPEAKNPNA